MKRTVKEKIDSLQFTTYTRTHEIESVLEQCAKRALFHHADQCGWVQGSVQGPRGRARHSSGADGKVCEDPDFDE